MPSTPSIHRRCQSLDYKILISPKKKKNTTRNKVVFFLLCRKYLVALKRESIPVKQQRSAKNAHLAVGKSVVNDTARALRISQASFFVLFT